MGNEAKVVTVSKELLMQLLGISEEEMKMKVRGGNIVSAGKHYDLGATLKNILSEGDVSTGAVVDSEYLGSIVGLSGRSIRELAQKGVLDRTDQGKYRFNESVKAYIQFLRAANDKGTDSKEEDIKRKRTERLLKEIKLKKESGGLHEAEVVRDFISKMLLSFKTSLVAIPDKIETMTEIDKSTKSIIQNCINQAIEELSEYEPRV